MGTNPSATFLSRLQSSHKSSTSLCNLSNEILINIIQCVSDAPSLFKLSLCSRRLFEVTEPILYSEFSQRGPKSLPTFLQRLLARPDLAGRTKIVTCTGCSEETLDEQDVSGLVEEDWMRVRAALHAAHLSDIQGKRWIEAFERGNWDALITLLFCITPNLEKVSFQEWGYYSDKPLAPFLDAVLARAVGLQLGAGPSPYSLSRLKSVDLSYHDTENGMEWDELEPFLRLKSVADFEAFAISEDDHGDRSDDRPPLPFTYWTKDLTLGYSVISHREMAYRFKAFKCLERLYYEHGHATVGYAAFEPPRMMAAIEHLKPCLKDLTILVDDPEDYGAEFQDYPMGSLAEFEKLTSIDVTSYLLIGEYPYDSDVDDEYDSLHVEDFPKRQRLVDSLPPTLTYLSLRDVQEHHVEHILDLILQKASRIPLLSKLNLHWHSTKYPDGSEPKIPKRHGEFRDEEAAEILAAAEVASIEVVIQYKPPEPKVVWYKRALTAEEEKQTASPFNPHKIFDIAAQYFGWPYEGYEEFCKEHGCDPSTGKAEGIC